jgi:hypothetical protein
MKYIVQVGIMLNFNLWFSRERFSGLVQCVYTGFSKDEDRAKAEAFFKVRVRRVHRPQTRHADFPSGQGYRQVQPSLSTGTGWY